MKLADILESLAYSDLTNLAVVANGEVVEEKIPLVVNAINVGLTKLYSRFKLKKDTLTLAVSPLYTSYDLIKTNTLSNNGTLKYILDSDKPFTGDLLEVETITDSMGCYIPFDGSRGLAMQSATMLKFKTAPLSDTYTVDYLALPSKVVYIDNTDIPVELPDAYLMALIYFIASRFYSSVGVALDSNRNSRDIEYMQRYEAECQLLENKGFDISEDVTNNLFSERGFV